MYTNNISYGTHRQTYAHGKRVDRGRGEGEGDGGRGKGEKKRKCVAHLHKFFTATCIAYFRYSCAARVVSSQNFKETFSTMIRIKLSRASDKLLLVTNDACYR